MRSLAPGLLLLFLVVSAPTAARAQEARPSEEEIGREQVYLTAPEALREIYGGVARIDTTTARLTPVEGERIAKALGRPVPAAPLQVFVPRGPNGGALGYAMVAEEVGKYRPITFLVGTTPDLRVKGVEVLIYRESRGGEVRRERFLRQYRGKRADDSIRINRDIINVAGATLSVNAMNAGVKRVLATLEALRARDALGGRR
jgi:hypothetical protein